MSRLTGSQPILGATLKTLVTAAALVVVPLAFLSGCTSNASAPAAPIDSTTAPYTYEPPSRTPDTNYISTPAPAAVAPPPATSPVGSSGSVYYANCAAARSAGAAPLQRGETGYRSGLDRDNDGVACEPYSGHSSSGSADSSKSISNGSSGPTYYANCSAARAAGAAPLHKGDPGYRSGLDRDNDGVACE